MVKIKTKKQLNLPELLEWIWANKQFKKTFTSDKYNFVDVTDTGMINFDGPFYDDIFTIEEDKEVDEDTILKNIVELCITEPSGNGIFMKYQLPYTIRHLKDEESLAFYVLNDDKTMTLLWTKERGLVE